MPTLTHFGRRAVGSSGVATVEVDWRPALLAASPVSSTRFSSAVGVTLGVR